MVKQIAQIVVIIATIIFIGGGCVGKSESWMGMYDIEGKLKFGYNLHSPILDSYDSCGDWCRSTAAALNQTCSERSNSFWSDTCTCGKNCKQEPLTANICEEIFEVDL